MSEPITWNHAQAINATRETRATYLQRVRDALEAFNHSGAWLAERMGKSASHVNTCLRNDYSALPLNFIQACALWLNVEPQAENT